MDNLLGGGGESQGDFRDEAPNPQRDSIEDIVNEKNEIGMRNAEDLCYQIIKISKIL